MSFPDKTIVLVGIMGAGKTRVGAELARLLGVPFVDSDKEIERAAGMSVRDVFETFGEAEFRSGERKVILRLLSGEPKVLATGGGAFMQDEIRAAIKQEAVSVWLKANLETLLERIPNPDSRPMLRGPDPAGRLKELMDLRYPVYAEADITVETARQSPQVMAKKIRAEVEKRGRTA